MIDTLTVPLEEYDLEGFIQGYSVFYRKWAGDDDVAQSTYVLEKFDETPMPLREDLDLLDVLTKRQVKTFFPMHEPLVDERVLCIDGQRRKSDDFDIGVGDSYGFLIELHDGQISLHPADPGFSA